jgi:hypothetical protein
MSAEVIVAHPRIVPDAFGMRCAHGQDDPDSLTATTHAVLRLRYAASVCRLLDLLAHFSLKPARRSLLVASATP